MLAGMPIIAFVPTKDFAKSRPFYEDTLGLRVLSHDDFALSLDANGTAVRVARVEDFVPAPFTILGWRVRDIRDVATRMQAKGVVFARFPGMTQDGLGLWTSPSGTRVGWFKDPDGNVLSISEY